MKNLVILFELFVKQNNARSKKGVVGNKGRAIPIIPSISDMIPIRLKKIL